MGDSQKKRRRDMAKFVTIGERLSVTAPTVNKAFAARDEEPILKRAKQQLDAGAVYLDVNIGPAENDGEDIMKWAVELLQSNFDNVPLALDTSNKKAIEAGISVYNRSKGKPIVNSADAAGRIEYVDLAAANDAIVIALCNGFNCCIKLLWFAIKRHKKSLLKNKFHTGISP
jgi:5-methyltetrahydrofolate corrinoid/iron sulfur protein methyltransferase